MAILTAWLRVIPGWKHLLLVPVEEANGLYTRLHPGAFEDEDVVARRDHASLTTAANA
jgi:hypothetical protein